MTMRERNAKPPRMVMPVRAMRVRAGAVGVCHAYGLKTV
jgi:hypothetical protein